MISSDNNDLENNSFVRSQVASLVPDCILLDIFKHLSVKQLCKCAQVCTQWRRVAQDSRFFYKMDLTDKSLSVREVRKFLHRFPCIEGVRDLRLCGFLQAGGVDWNKPTLTLATLKLLRRKMPNLTCLTVENSLFKNVNNFIRLDDFPSTLRHLGLRGTWFIPSVLFGYHCLWKVSTECLDIGQCSVLRTSDLYCLSQFRSLHCLYLDGCYHFNSEGLENLLPLLTHLTLLDIEMTDVCDEGIELLIDNGHELTELYIGCNSITDEAFIDVDDQVLTKLEVLCVSDTLVTNETIDNLKTIIPQLSVINTTRDDSWYIDGIPKWCRHHLHHVCEHFK